MPEIHEFQELTGHWDICPEKIIQLNKNKSYEYEYLQNYNTEK